MYYTDKVFVYRIYHNHSNYYPHLVNESILVQQEQGIITPTDPKNITNQTLQQGYPTEDKDMSTGIEINNKNN